MSMLSRSDGEFLFTKKLLEVLKCGQCKAPGDIILAKMKFTYRFGRILCIFG